MIISSLQFAFSWVRLFCYFFFKRKKWNSFEMDWRHLISAKNRKLQEGMCALVEVEMSLNAIC